MDCGAQSVSAALEWATLRLTGAAVLQLVDLLDL
jgi:hypothetical protein